MAGDLNYAIEKFSLAVHRLAVGRDNIKIRLLAAFTEICPVAERDIPTALVDDHRWIMSELTKRPAREIDYRDGKIIEGAEGRIGATLKSMRFSKAVEIAERIVALSHELSVVPPAELTRATAE